MRYDGLEVSGCSRPRKEKGTAEIREVVGGRRTLRSDVEVSVLGLARKAIRTEITRKSSSWKEQGDLGFSEPGKLGMSPKKKAPASIPEDSLKILVQPAALAAVMQPKFDDDIKVSYPVSL